MKKLAYYKNGNALSYSECGHKNGYPILLQHGLIASIEDDDLFESLVDLGTRLISIARPGYGESSPYLMENVAEWGESISSSTPSAVLGQTVTYTITLQNLPVTGTKTVNVSDTLPAGLSYVAGSLSASKDQPDDSGQPTLAWSGTMDSASLVTITYQATVTDAAPNFLINTATITSADFATITRSHTLAVNTHATFIPIVLK